MVLENLGKSLHSALQKLTKSGSVDKKTVKGLTKDIQKALLQSDVNVKLVLDLTKKIEKRALEEEVPTGISRKEHIVTIVYEEISNFVDNYSEFSPGKVNKVLEKCIAMLESNVYINVVLLETFFKIKKFAFKK